MNRFALLFFSVVALPGCGEPLPVGVVIRTDTASLAPGTYVRTAHFLWAPPTERTYLIEDRGAAYLREIGVAFSVPATTRVSFAASPDAIPDDPEFWRAHASDAHAQLLPFDCKLEASCSIDVTLTATIATTETQTTETDAATAVTTSVLANNRFITATLTPWGVP